jgi:hypothetical protein
LTRTYVRIRTARSQRTIGRRARGTTASPSGGNRADIVLESGAKSSLWWATKNELLGLVDVAGLEVEAAFGGFAGEPLTDESREYVFVARRPATG